METKTKVAEFEIGDLLGIAMTFVILGIAITYGVEVQSDVRTDMVDSLSCSNASYNIKADSPANCELTANTSQPTVGAVLSSEWNASTSAMTGVSNIAGKIPTVATIVIAAIIIGILVRYMVVRYS